MMRILVISDSHGDSWRLRQIIDAQPEARYIFHLGDGAEEMEAIKETLPGKICYQARGNCDFDHSLPLNIVDEISGIRIYACHGYIERVKYGTGLLLDVALENKAAIALYGHTHTPATEYVDGVWLFNPGCAHNGEYGVIDIERNGFLPSLMKLV